MGPVVTFYIQGYTLTELIYVFSLKEEDLQNLFDELTPKVVKKHNKNLHKRILKMNKQGYPVKAINQITGISSNTIWNMIYSE